MELHPIAGRFIPASITIRTDPDGLSFSADGTVYSSPHTFTWLIGSKHTISIETQQATEGMRYVFAKWSDSGTESHTISVPSSATTYTADLTAQYRLTASASPPNGGRIMASPASADGYYAAGTPVQLTANAAGGYRFAGWSGSATGTMNPKTITMSGAHNVSATFEPAGANRPLRSAPQVPNRVRKKRDIRDRPD